MFKKRSAAWKYIAKEFERISAKLEKEEAAAEAEGDYVFTTHADGLCSAVSRMLNGVTLENYNPSFRGTSINHELYKKMNDDIDSQAVTDTEGDFLGFEREFEGTGDVLTPRYSDYMFEPGVLEPRIIMAQLFALAAEDEGD